MPYAGPASPTRPAPTPSPFSRAPPSPPSSAPAIPSPARRAKPALKAPPSALKAPAPRARARSEPSVPKTVHFPAPDAGLATVRLFRRRARPASLSLPRADDTATETESEAESDAAPGPRWVSAAGSPFNPRVKANPANPLAKANARWHRPRRYVLDAPRGPRRPAPGSAAMVLVEALALHYGDGDDDFPGDATPGTGPTLRGTLLARNAAFEKHLSVRFTLDAWGTAGEVRARWVESAASSSSCRSSMEGNAGPRARADVDIDVDVDADADVDGEEPGPGWDRFAFAIGLADYEGRTGLDGRELALAARFCAPWVRAGGAAPYVWCDALAGAGRSAAGRAWVGTGNGGAAGPGEWWDNNGGRDHRVRFRAVAAPRAPSPLAPPAPSARMIAFPARGEEGGGGGDGDGDEGEVEAAETPPKSSAGAGVVSWPTRAPAAVPDAYKALVRRWCYGGAGMGMGMGTGMGMGGGAAAVVM